MSNVNHSVCPQCGGHMLKTSGGLLCGNCGTFVSSDGKVWAAPSSAINVTTNETELSFWDRFRAEAAKDILCAMIANPTSFSFGGKELKTLGDYQDAAVGLAGILIKRLKGETE